MNIQPQLIKLNQLQAGADNPRKVATDKASHATLVASIRALGLINPLLVSANGKGTYQVIAGNRRFAAVQALAKTDKLFADGVMCCVADKDAHNKSLALAENIIREDMNHVDVYEAFNALAQDGIKLAEIGARYGVTEIEVKRYLALGNLAPTLMKKFRNEELRLETAKALTLVADHKQQVKLFKEYGNSVHGIKEAVSEEAYRIADGRGQAKLVLDKYRKAGGAETSDLFSDTILLRDRKLVMRLVDEVLDAEVARLEKQGWKSVAKTYLDVSWDWNLEEAGLVKGLTQNGGDIPIAKRGAYQVFIGIDGDGDMVASYGWYKPEAVSAKPQAKGKADGKGQAQSPATLYSAALAQHLTDLRTAAFGLAIAQSDPALLVQLAKLTIVRSVLMNRGGLFGIETNRFGAGSPEANDVFASHAKLGATAHGDKGFPANDDEALYALLHDDDGTFATALDTAFKCAMGMIVQRQNLGMPTRRGMSVLVERIGLDLAAAWRPDAGYWKRFGKAKTLAVAETLLGKGWVGVHAKLKATEIAEAMAAACRGADTARCKLTDAQRTAALAYLPEGMAMTAPAPKQADKPQGAKRTPNGKASK